MYIIIFYIYIYVYVGNKMIENGNYLLNKKQTSVNNDSWGNSYP